MNVSCTARRLTAQPRPSLSHLQSLDLSDLSKCLAELCLSPRRFYHHTPRLQGLPKLSQETFDSAKITGSKRDGLSAKTPFPSYSLKQKPAHLRKSPDQVAAAAAAAAAERAKKLAATQTAAATQGAGVQGSLADNSLFADESTKQVKGEDSEGKDAEAGADPHSLSARNRRHLEPALNPRPHARVRWTRNMVIRQICRSGRLTKEMKISRSERSHLSKSHFFKTSMKKLAPLARQIAGKSIDEAILQMRFSAKKAARDVRAHLIQARNEAIVMRGMGLAPRPAEDAVLKEAADETSSPITLDAASSPPNPEQTPLKSYKDGVAARETDIYIAQSWVNRGPYGQEPDYRARGRMFIMRPPHTGISILLKEEKTRTREADEKMAKKIRKRLGKSMWTQLPDRRVVRQSQYVLW